LLHLKPRIFSAYSERLLRSRFLFHALKTVMAVFVSILFVYTSAAAFQLTLAWDSNVDEDLAGYIVYYGTASHDYKWNVDIGEETSVTISGLDDRKNYYFAVTAYDEEGNESAYSEEIAYPDSANSSASNRDSGGSASMACFISSAADGGWPETHLMVLVGVILAAIFGLLIYRRSLA
jgi:hypothetical protein